MEITGRGERHLRRVLIVLGLVMVVAGSVTTLFGMDPISGDVVVTPDADSEMRFYAVWYVVVGVLLLRSVRDVASATNIVRFVGFGFFAAGCARAVSWAVVGRPGTVAIVLMVIELLLPLILIPWQTAVARNAAPG
jgi:hypothetical protein